MPTFKKSQHKLLKTCLADEELRLEEDSLQESRRRAMEEQRHVLFEAQQQEDEHRHQEERKRKNREHRENVISELVVTEREFCKDLKLTSQAFSLDTPAMLEQRGVDVVTLFGNIADVIDISERFLDTLQEEVKSKSNSEEQMVGKCFLQHSETMKIVYTEYCIGFDKAEQLLKKYESVQEIQKMLQKGVETLQSQVTCFNMGSILIKPVQRILKYPLMLNELIKCTEDTHRDRVDLMDAVCIMSDVASFINESKRRKDIIDKYKTEEDQKILRKISKLNMHSIGKKSSRISTKLLSSIGIEPVSRDFDFDDYEKRFNYLVRAIQSFSTDSQRFREQQHQSVAFQCSIGEIIVDLYGDCVHIREVERFQTAHHNIISTYWNEFNSKMKPRVIRPLQVLLENLQGPSRLIQKRHDKQLDLQASTQKSEKNRDPTKTRSLNEEVDKCRANFEALNSQLLEQLPKLLDVAGSIFSDSVNEFVLLRKFYVGRVTKELLSLMDLPLLESTSGDILEAFLTKHSMVCDQLGRYSFSSKAFRPEDKKKTSQSLAGQQLGQKAHKNVPQGSSIQTMLRGKYPADKLYQANQSYVPADLLDVSISPGDLVGVIQKKDPIGSTKRWFVDDGLTQGFLPCHVLAPCGDIFNQACHGPTMTIPLKPLPATAESGAASPASTFHLYGVVDEEKHVAYELQQQALPQQPVRKAPPVPRLEKVVKGGHSYEEISASVPDSGSSQDYSPIYEEILEGSRSNISSNSFSSSSRSVSSNESKSNNQESSDAIQQGKFYYALYDFTATEDTMLSLFTGQVLRVAYVSGEWCYVEDRNANKGYVPSSYLELYSVVQSNVSTGTPSINNNTIEKL